MGTPAGNYGPAQAYGRGDGLIYEAASVNLSGQISSFSPRGKNIDLLAPGDSSFALCTANPDRYQYCTDFTGKPSDVERSGGTSESAPLTAGAAALVIQAYRQSHHGSSPSPAHPDLVDTTARSMAIASRTFRLVPAETNVGTTTRFAST